jgi:hypothetical protein
VTVPPHFKLGFWGRYLAKYRFCRLFGRYGRWRSFVEAMLVAWKNPANLSGRFRICDWPDLPQNQPVPPFRLRSNYCVAQVDEKRHVITLDGRRRRFRSAGPPLKLNRIFEFRLPKRKPRRSGARVSMWGCPQGTGHPSLTYF